MTLCINDNKLGLLNVHELYTLYHLKFTKDGRNICLRCKIC